MHPILLKTAHQWIAWCFILDAVGVNVAFSPSVQPTKKRSILSPQSEDVKWLLNSRELEKQKKVDMCMCVCVCVCVCVSGVLYEALCYILHEWKLIYKQSLINSLIEVHFCCRVYCYYFRMFCLYIHITSHISSCLSYVVKISVRNFLLSSQFLHFIQEDVHLEFRA